MTFCRAHETKLKRKCTKIKTASKHYTFITQKRKKTKQTNKHSHTQRQTRQHPVPQAQPIHSQTHVETIPFYSFRNLCKMTTSLVPFFFFLGIQKTPAASGHRIQRE